MKLFVVGLPEAVAAAGRQVVVICPEDRWIREYCVKLGAQFTPVEFRRDIDLRADVSSLFCLYRHLRRVRPGTIFYGSPKASLLSALAGAGLRIPRRLYVLHGLRYESASGFSRAVLLGMELATCVMSTVVAGVSPSVADTVNKWLPSSRKAIVPGWGSANGIDTRRYRMPSLAEATAARRSLGLDGGLVVAFVGRFAKDKGVRLLPAIMDELSRLHPGVRMVLAGADEGEEETRVALESLKRRNDVHILGEVDNPELVYWACDVLISPTTREGLGMSLVEAAACGVPVVASEVTGCVDVVTEDLIGELVRSRRPADWAAAVDSVLRRERERDPVVRSALMSSRYGRESVVQHWSELLSRGTR